MGLFGIKSDQPGVVVAGDWLKSILAPGATAEQEKRAWAAEKRRTDRRVREALREAEKKSKRKEDKAKRQFQQQMAQRG